jgi:hypothetical protein
VIPPTLRQLVDRLEALEQEHDPRTVVIVSTAVDAEGADADFVVVTGVAEADPDYEPADRYPPVLGPEDAPVVDRSAVVEEALHRPEGIRHSLETVIRWLPRW